MQPAATDTHAHNQSTRLGSLFYKYYRHNVTYICTDTQYVNNHSNKEHAHPAVYGKQTLIQTKALLLSTCCGEGGVGQPESGRAGRGGKLSEPLLCC